MEDTLRSMQPRLRLAGGFETILSSHPIRGEPGIDDSERLREHFHGPVSYTHLTLPTIE